MLTWHDRWRGRRVVVTGHTGFKGAWLTLWLQRLGAVVSGLSLPAENGRSAFPAMAPWADLDQVTVDVRDGKGVKAAVEASRPEIIFHLAAQSLVRRGFENPGRTYEVNVCGTSHVIEAAVRSAVPAVVVVTSDKVYANPEHGRAFVESDRLGGRDPYSASKACAELVTASWRSMAGTTRMATARAGNVIGGGDVAPDRLLPDAERALQMATPVHVRHPDSVRPWQFVLEPLYGYLLLASLLVEHGDSAPATLNFGPGPKSCLPVRDVVARITKLCGLAGWVPANDPGPPEAGILRLDAAEAQSALGWRSRLDVDTALAWTVEWWQRSASGGDLRALATEQIERYEALLGE